MTAVWKAVNRNLNYFRILIICYLIICIINIIQTYAFKQLHLYFWTIALSQKDFWTIAIGMILNDSFQVIFSRFVCLSFGFKAPTFVLFIIQKFSAINILKLFFYYRCLFVRCSVQILYKTNFLKIFLINLITHFSAGSRASRDRPPQARQQVGGPSDHLLVLRRLPHPHLSPLPIQAHLAGVLCRTR